MDKIRTTPLHPGEILRHEFVLPLGLSARSLAQKLGWPTNRLTEIMNGERKVTAETAIGLAKYFNTSVEFWMNLQVTYDLEKAGYIRDIPVKEANNAEKAQARQADPLPEV